MSITYTPATNFNAKDSLPTNDPDKVIKGSEFSTEFTAIQTAFGLAAPAASPTFTGTVTISSVDINGGTLDGVTIGGSSAGAITGTTGQFNTSLNVDGTVTADGLTVDGVGSITSSSTELLDLTSTGGDSLIRFGSLNSNFDVRIGSPSNPSVQGSAFVIRTSGDDRLNIANNGDISFYEDTGTTPKFFWDASAEALGIGTSSPDDKLHISGSGLVTIKVESTDDSNAQIHLRNVGSTDQKITAQNGELLFEQGGNEAMRIDSSGNLLVGKTSSSLATDGVEAKANGSLFVTRSSATPVSFRRSTTDGDVVAFYKDGTEVGSIGTDAGRIYITDDAQAGISFASASQAVVPCTPSGALNDNAVNLGAFSARWKDLYLSGGVYLGGTGAANLLDDYEEGGGTVYFSDAISGGNNATFGFSRFRYTKIGRQVTLNINMYNINTSGLTSGNTIYITNLPFVCEDSTYVGTVYTNLFDAGGTDMYLTCDIPGNTSYIRLQSSQTDGGAAAVLTVAAVTSTNADMGITITYFTA